VNLAALTQAAEAAGLALRGAIRLDPEERVGPLAAARSVALFGFVGGRQWPAFAASPEAADGLAHPLDRWSRRVLSALGEPYGATALFPSDGPPYMPFQRWAQRAEPVAPSPLGLFIHPRYGLWHSYRGALAFAQALDGVDREPEASPCEACDDRPCLSACPVGAFTGAGYDVAACAAWVQGEGRPCAQGGCLSRHACPVGRDYAYGPEQASFYMRAFVAARA
jgi:hypothetical protein